MPASPTSSKWTRPLMILCVFLSGFLISAPITYLLSRTRYCTLPPPARAVQPLQVGMCPNRTTYPESCIFKSVDEVRDTAAPTDFGIKGHLLAYRGLFEMPGVQCKWFYADGKEIGGVGYKQFDWKPEEIDLQIHSTSSGPIEEGVEGVQCE